MVTSADSVLEERVQFRVSANAAERLRDLARTEETTLGTILRRAVRRFLLEEEAGRREREEPEP